MQSAVRHTLRQSPVDDVCQVKVFVVHGFGQADAVAELDRHLQSRVRVQEWRDDLLKKYRKLEGHARADAQPTGLALAHAAYGPRRAFRLTQHLRGDGVEHLAFRREVDATFAVDE